MQPSWRSLSQPVRRPVVTTFLVAGVAMAWAIQWLAQQAEDGGTDPVLDAGALTVVGLRDGYWWQMGTHLFVAAGPAWLGAASLGVLALAGRGLERILGGKRVGQIFALAGVLGGLGQAGFDAMLGQSGLVAGVSSAAMGVLLALACVSPRTPLLPWPMRGRAGGRVWPWQRVKAIHVTLGALVASVGAGTTPPAAGALVGGLTGCLYVHALGFCGRRTEDEEDKMRGAPNVSAASSASWPPGAKGPPVTESKMPPTGAAGDAPTVLTAPATAAAARDTLVAQRFTERERRMSAREFIAEKVDPVLDKISREGLGSLTAEERQLLEKAREKMSEG